MIKEIQGDVFKAKEDLLIHGCNCFRAMGAGIAKGIRELYHGAWFEDQKSLWGDKIKLGNYTFWTGQHYYYPQNITVINIYTQYKYGHTEVYADYNAITNGLLQVKDNFPNKSIAMPRIGAGLARGDWNVIFRIINDVFTDDRDVKIYYL